MPAKCHKAARPVDRERIARDVTRLRAAIKALARARGVEPPDSRVAELLRFLEGLEVDPGELFRAVFGGGAPVE